MDHSLVLAIRYIAGIVTKARQSAGNLLLLWLVPAAVTRGGSHRDDGTFASTEGAIQTSSEQTDQIRPPSGRAGAPASDPGVDPARLLERATAAPLEHRPNWLRDVSGFEHLFVVAGAREAAAADGGGATGAVAVPVEKRPTRALPGHVRLRVRRFGSAGSAEVLGDLLERFADLVRTNDTFLSINVEVFAPDPDRRREIGELARRAGFEPARGQRRYRHTARLDLAPTEEELLASFSASCRRFIRDPAKKDFSVRPLLEEGWAARMHELWEETFQRTGGHRPPRSWSDHLRYARNHPDRYRIMGTFGPDQPDEGSLAAFACAMHNGDHAVYSDGASTRDLDTTVALTYAPMWELIRWARARGCEWFDMGGITDGTYEDDDPRGGISDFKRRFTEEVIEVGGEWSYTAPSVRATLADGIRRAAGTVRGALRRLGVGS